jgi:multidrug efflux pump subunit AcrB
VKNIVYNSVALSVILLAPQLGRHILSTTFATVGGLIPLLLFSEGTLWPPLAVVLAGGVGFSIILTLVFTPVLVARLCRVRTKSQSNVKSKVSLQAS